MVPQPGEGVCRLLLPHAACWTHALGDRPTFAPLVWDLGAGRGSSRGFSRLLPNRLKKKSNRI